MSENIESKTQFKDTPQGQQERWTVELKAAMENVKDWRENQAKRAIKAYLGEGGTLNLFHADVDTILSVVYGQVPSVDVSRRFNDAQDDTARVASEMLERLLQTDIEREDDGFQSSLRYALKDWKIAGMGQAWLRYEAEFEEQPEQPAMMRQDPVTGEEIEVAPAVPAMTVKALDPKGKGAKEEDAETDYVHFEDFLYQPARSWHEVDWVARKAEMTRDDLTERFGEEKAKTVPLHQKEVSGSEDASNEIKDVWSRAEVWEIWCKSSKAVYWFSFGMSEILETKPDPLDLEGFFPCPRPLVSNVATTKFVPRPDYELSRHLYEEIDDLAKRIRNLEDCAKVRWVYDGSQTDLRRIFDETLEGEGVGVKNWLELTAKGGIEGAMGFVPIDPIVKAIALLTEKLHDKIEMLRQSSGIADIVRGSSNPNETLGAQKIKAGFTGTRLQSSQDEVARFASDIQKIRAEIISKHFDPETIIARSNIGQTPDAARAMEAAQLIKSDALQFRVDVKADSIALRDYAALKQERSETIQAVSQLFTAGMPIVQVFPPFGEFMLGMAEWLIAATKGSQEMEGLFDEFKAKAAQFAAQAQQPKPPDPQIAMEQQKTQAEVMKAQAGVETAKIGVATAQIGLQKEKMGIMKEVVKAAQPPQPPQGVPQ